MTIEDLLKEVYKCKTNEEVSKLIDKYIEVIEYPEEPKNKTKTKNKGGRRR